MRRTTDDVDNSNIKPLGFNKTLCHLTPRRSGMRHCNGASLIAGASDASGDSRSGQSRTSRVGAGQFGSADVAAPRPAGRRAALDASGRICFVNLVLVVVVLFGAACGASNADGQDTALDPVARTWVTITPPTAPQQ